MLISRESPGEARKTRLDYRKQSLPLTHLKRPKNLCKVLVSLNVDVLFLTEDWIRRGAFTAHGNTFSESNVDNTGGF